MKKFVIFFVDNFLICVWRFAFGGLRLRFAFGGLRLAVPVMVVCVCRFAFSSLRLAVCVWRFVTLSISYRYFIDILSIFFSISYRYFFFSISYRYFFDILSIFYRYLIDTLSIPFLTDFMPYGYLCLFASLSISIIWIPLYIQNIPQLNNASISQQPSVQSCFSRPLQ